MKRKILFVEEQPTARRDLEAALATWSGTFEMTFVHSGTDALEKLEQQPFDAIVTELRLSPNYAELRTECRIHIRQHA